MKWGFGKPRREFLKFVLSSVNTNLKYVLHKHALLHVSSGVYVWAATICFAKWSLYSVELLGSHSSNTLNKHGIVLLIMLCIKEKYVIKEQNKADQTDPL